MDEERFVQVIHESHERRLMFRLNIIPLDVVVLHGCLRLTATHPDVSSRLDAYAARAKHIRDILLEFMAEMGFTEQELAYLDSVDENGNPLPGEKVSGDGETPD